MAEFYRRLFAKGKSGLKQAENGVVEDETKNGVDSRPRVRRVSDNPPGDMPSGTWYDESDDTSNMPNIAAERVEKSPKDKYKEEQAKRLGLWSGADEVTYLN